MQEVIGSTPIFSTLKKIKAHIARSQICSMGFFVGVGTKLLFSYPNTDYLVLSMPESLNQPIVFLPKATKPSLFYHWLMPLSIATMAFIRSGFSFQGFLISALCFLIARFPALQFKKPISLTFHMKDGVLEFCYKSFWGKTKVQTINILTALGNYKCILTKWYRTQWKLLLYEQWWFHNRLVLYENDEAGFSKEQLDQIVKLIEGYKASSN